MIAFLHEDRIERAVVVRHDPIARFLRLEIPGMRGDPWLARRLVAAARSWPGVVDARTNHRSGRMRIEYAAGAPLLRQLREERSDGLLLRERSGEPRALPARRGDWHALPIEKVFAALGSGRTGLSSGEAAKRLGQHGPNLAELAAPRSRLALLADQLASAPMAMLAGSAAASALLGDLLECAAIVVVIGLDAGIGYRVERRNREILASWRRLEGGLVPVVRDGSVRTVPAAELVPGDLFLLRAGDVVPADARVVESHGLCANEAALTGEVEPQAKRAAPVSPDAPLAERPSMLHAGTTVASGHGRALVVATGGETRVARIRELVESSSAPPPPLEVRMERLGSRVGSLALGAAALAAGAGLLHGRPPASVLRAGVALAVAALPEGLPLVATSALVRSMQRLYEQGLVVRRVAAAEALGGVTVICADKTGTLTRNEMALEVLHVDGRDLGPAEIRSRPERLFDDPTTLALAAAMLNSDVDVVQRSGAPGYLAGSATERALVDAATAAGLDRAALHARFPRLRLIERSAGVHYVVSLHDTPDGVGLAFLKGAPEQVLELCDRTPSGPLDPARRRAILEENDRLAARGLRVLALAWRRGRADPAVEPGGFVHLGLVGLHDPLRGGAAETISRARDAGIRTLILTGDQLRTARAVASALRLPGETRLASEVLRLPPEALAAELDRLAVLARVTPEEKVAIVRSLRRSGEVVAMAGDGINDAPALKAADVGIAVGAGATDLARQVADLVMSGDDLRSILSAVGEGRIVQDNLRRALRFLLATNLSEVALVLGAALLGASDPLTPMQLLWINLLTDTIPGLALALEPGEPDVLDRPPTRPGEELLRGPVLRGVCRDALLLAGTGAAGLAVGGPSLAFATLTGAQIAYAALCRAPQRHYGRERQQADRRFAALLGGGLGLQLLALGAPELRRLLGVGRSPLLLCGGLAAGFGLPRLLGGPPAAGKVVRRGRAASASAPLGQTEAYP